MDVTIVRPKMSARESGMLLLTMMFNRLLSAWLLMLLLGALTNWGFSYWYTLGVYYAIQLAAPGGDGWRIWTKEAK